MANQFGPTLSIDRMPLYSRAFYTARFLFWGTLLALTTTAGVAGAGVAADAFGNNLDVTQDVASSLGFDVPESMSVEAGLGGLVVAIAAATLIWRKLWINTNFNRVARIGRD